MKGFSYPKIGKLEYLPARRVQRVGIIGKMTERVESKKREIKLNQHN